MVELEKIKMTKEQYIKVDQINELPKMNLTLRETIGEHDFEKRHIDLLVSGFTINECKESMDYLLSRIKRLERRDKNEFRKETFC